MNECVNTRTVCWNVQYGIIIIFVGYIVAIHMILQTYMNHFLLNVKEAHTDGS